MQAIEFEGFILDDERRELRDPGGEIIVLKSKVFDTLSVFLSQPGQIISKEELMDRVWPNVTVEENNLNQTISALRRALGDNRETPRFIQTIPRQGYRFMPEVRRVGYSTQPTAPTEKPAGVAPGSASSLVARLGLKLARPQATALAALIIVSLAIMVVAGGALNQRAAAASRSPSIAVLPFEDISPGAERDHFARGIAIEVIDILSQLDGLEVIDRNSSFAFGPLADARKTGRSLGVSHILSGSIRTANDRVRITAQLASTRSGKQLWTRTYERDLSAENLFAVQRLIAEHVSGALSIAFDVDAGERVAGAGTRSLEAYDYYLRGYEMWFYGGTDYPAVDLFQRAIDADPGYAAAWAGKAFATQQTSWQAGSPQREREVLEEAMALARRSIELDPGAAAGHAVLGVGFYLRNDWIGARQEFDIALARTRNQLTLAYASLFLLRTGALQDARDMMSALRDVDPLTNPLSVREDVIRANLGDFAFGLEQTAQMLEISPTQFDLALPRLITQLNAGSPDSDIRSTLARISRSEAREAAQLAAAVLGDPSRDAIRNRLRREYTTGVDYPSRTVLLVHLAAWVRDHDLVMDIWDADLRQTPLRAVWLWGPVFSETRQRPAFRQLMRDINLVDYWRAYGWADHCRPLNDDDFVCN